MTVLVAVASRHGATAEIAERIGRDLADRGLSVEVQKLPVADDDIARYEAFVIGSAIYLGKWMKDATRFVEGHVDDLTEHPTWLFASGSIVGDPPVADDPNAMRPSLAEKLVASTHALEHKLFAGKLDGSRLGFTERLPVKMAGGREGDWRDWDAVDTWAASIAEHLRQPVDARSAETGGLATRGGRR
jgi:menaquinone-dependent protoporphyrinogen oxidase